MRAYSILFYFADVFFSYHQALVVHDLGRFNALLHRMIFQRLPKPSDLGGEFIELLLNNL